MGISIFLARFLGLLFVILYGSFLLNPVFYRRLVQDISRQPLSLLLSGVISLILGLSVTLIHNIWTPDWRGLITFLGWLFLFSGIMRLAFPQVVIKMTQRMLEKGHDFFLNAVVFVMLLVGVYLTYIGFSY